jgi:hypothetical protein
MLVKTCYKPELIKTFSFLRVTVGFYSISGCCVAIDEQNMLQVCSQESSHGFGFILLFALVTALFLIYG